MATAINQREILTVQVKLRNGAEPRFIAWQEKLNAAITQAPAFVSLEIASHDPEKKQWFITQRFTSHEGASAWQESASCLALMNELTDLAMPGGCLKGIGERESSLGSVTEVFVTDVDPQDIAAFREWNARIHYEEAKHPGFKGVYVQSPAQGKGRHWITMLQFDTPEHLDLWLASPERKQILDEPVPWMKTLESHRVISPYGGWFSSLAKKGTVPPAWKQTMVVLLILFPIVMLEMIFLNPFTAGLNPSLAMFIGNVISVTLIAWPGSPLAIKLLNWWLSPSKGNSKAISFWGAMLVCALYLVTIAFFWWYFS
jgi:antibiotic biosynthesis monooxygenase (ABM) superfamily enzyme